MKALTLTQPWASLMALRRKEIETRSWGTSYRGPLVIHAAQGFPSDARDLCSNYIFAEALDRRPAKDLPRGAGLCVVELLACVQIGVRYEWAVKVRCALGHPLLPDELAFGNYEPGRVAWVTRFIELFPEPIPARGALSLWDWKG